MRKFLILSSALTILTTGCSFLGLEEEEKPLEGVRYSALELQKVLEPTNPAVKTDQYVAPQAWKNDYWTQSGGYPNHNLQNISFSSTALQKLWQADIGTGGNEKFPLTAQPLVYGRAVYAMDSKSVVSAFDRLSGKKIWQNTLRAEKEDEDVISGGLSISGTILYATNGYGELIAMNAANGGIQWRIKLTAPSRAAPTIAGDKIFILTLDNRVSAYETTSGRQLWSYEGISEVAGLLGAASPAFENDILVCPMSSGELTALQADTGTALWSDSLSPSLQTGGASSLPDINANPVIDKGVVIAISYGGKIVGIDISSGQRLWSRDIGGAKHPFVSGNMIFFISSNAELVALARDTGTLVWVKPLTSYEQNKNTRNSLFWNGPLVAGTKIILSGADKTLYEISPVDGSLIRSLKLGSHIAVSPVVAGETLYLLDDDGILSAWK